MLRAHRWLRPRRGTPATDQADLLEGLPHAVVEVDPQGRLVRANRAWWQTPGAQAGDQRSWVQWLSPDGQLAAALATGEPVDLVLPHSVAGQDRWLRLRAAAGNGHRLVVVDDTTSQRRAGLLLSHEASVEPLTGLPNRASLTRRLEDAMRPAPDRRRGALLYVDLDRFKDVNDGFGHDVGDQVLRTVAARLRRTARATDLVARLGGDEFVLLAADVEDVVEAALVADRVRHAVEQPVWIEGRPVHVGASVGTVLLDECDDAPGALRVADTVMQRTKRGRRGPHDGPLVTAHQDPLRHTVSFYDDEALLVAEVADLVASSLRAGRSSIAIATPAHGAGVAALLEARGLDLSAARRDGRFVCLDAEQALDALLVDGVPDHDRFSQVVGEPLRRLLDLGPGVDAYGEMVSLLWSRGDARGALALEDLWNDLQRELPFRLHCAYAVKDALAPPDAHGLHAVCVRHSHVL